MAAKRSALKASNLVVAKQRQGGDAPAAAPAAAAPAAKVAAPEPKRATSAGPGMAITSVHLPRDLLKLLRLASINRADLHGGRPSVSDVIRDLLERHRAEIEDEAGQ